MPEKRTERARRPRSRNSWPGLLLLILFSPVIVPLILVVVIAWVAGAVALHVLTLIVWLPVGRRVLFVYSDSPVWKVHVEAEILPRLPATAAVLNWSERKKWASWSLAAWLFRFYGGSREYNPLAIVIRPLLGPRIFRFWRAFRESKHGKPELLRALEAALFQAINAS